MASFQSTSAHCRRISVIDGPAWDRCLARLASASQENNLLHETGLLATYTILLERLSLCLQGLSLEHEVFKCGKHAFVAGSAAKRCKVYLRGLCQHCARLMRGPPARCVVHFLLQQVFVRQKNPGGGIIATRAEGASGLSAMSPATHGVCVQAVLEERALLRSSIEALQASNTQPVPHFCKFCKLWLLN